MQAADGYFKAQNGIQAETARPLDAELEQYLPTASTSSILAKLQSLPRHKAHQAAADLKHSVTRLSEQGLLERLSWSGSRLVWTRGDCIERIFDFDVLLQPSSSSSALPDPATTVRQALWANFSSEPAAPPSRRQTAASQPQDQAKLLFGPFSQPLAAPWTDARPQSQAASDQADQQRNGICVFLSGSLHIIFPRTGQTHVVQMPFLLKRAWSNGDGGLLIERMLEADEESKQPFGLDAALPTLYTLRDPYDELRYVSIQHLQPNPPAVSQPFTSARSDLLLVEPAYDLALLFNRTDCRLHLCRMKTVQPSKVPTPHLDSLQQAGLAPDGGRNTPRELASSSSGNAKGKRPSMARGLSQIGHALPPDRTFAAETPHPVGMDANINPAVLSGDFPTVAAAGVALPGGQDIQCELCLEVLWQSTDAVTLRPDERPKAEIFDERPDQALLAVHAPARKIVYLFQLNSLATTPVVQELRTEPALEIYRCVSTRPQLHDLLLWQSDQQSLLLSANARTIPFTADLRQAKEVEVTDHWLSSSDSNILTDLRRYAHADTLAQQCWEAISLALTSDEFLRFYAPFCQRSAAQDQWKCLEELLIGQQVSGEDDADHLWQQLLTSKGLPHEGIALSHQRGHSQSLPLDATRRLLQALHLVFQDCLCLHDRWPDASRLGLLLAFLSVQTGWSAWTSYYARLGFEVASSAPFQESGPGVPDLHHTLASHLRGQNTAWSSFAAFSPEAPSHFFGASVQPDRQCQRMVAVFAPFSAANQCTAIEKAQAVVEALHEQGFTLHSLDEVSFGLALPIREAIRSCVANPPLHWRPQLFALVGRTDLVKQAAGELASTKLKGSSHATPNIDECCSPVEDFLAKYRRSDEQSSLKGRASGQRPQELSMFDDRRLEEVGRLLRWSAPLALRMPDVTENSEAPSQEKQMAFALSIAARTQSLACGAALLHFCCGPSLRSNELICIPDITFQVKIIPLSAIVTPDLAALPGERRRWPKFHSGVATALRQKREDSATFDSSEIAFNKPAAELDSRHAGYLLGLGLTGQIRSIAVFQAFSYLDPKHELTSIGVLLGLSAAFVGTADAKVSSVLAVHLAALHPTGSAELNITLLTQCSAMLGIGILYMNTQRRSMAETVLRELSKILLQNKEQAEGCREAYALSAGFAFGMIMLCDGRGGGKSADEVLLRKFKGLIDGDGQTPLPGSKTDSYHGVDVSITSPAATVGLALMFLDSNRQDVLDLLPLPQTEARLDYIRPDLIMLRTIGRNLIQLQSAQASPIWIQSLLPAFIARAHRQSQQAGAFPTMDLELAYWSVVTGACFTIGLKYAGTASLEAHKTLSLFLDALSRPFAAKSATLRGKLRRHALQRAFNVILVALAMVFAGTGELHILRRIRVMHGKVGELQDYGSHLAVHMALGLLFLGGGKQTVSSKAPGQLAALFLAFYPIWPRSSSDNRMHLQAYRHFWVLAVEPRCLQVKDVEADQSVHMPVKLAIKDSSTAAAGDSRSCSSLVAPSLMPDISRIRSIKIDSPRYWPVLLDLDSQQTQRAQLIANQTVYVKRHAGRLDYTVDAKGIKGINSRSGLDSESIVSELSQMSLQPGKTEVALEEVVASFSSDPHALATLKHLVQDEEGAEASSKLFEAFSSSVLMECLSADKMDLSQAYHSMFTAAELGSPSSLLPLQSLIFGLDFYISLTWSAIFCPPGDDEAASRLPLLERAFVERLRLKLELEVIQQLQHSSEAVGASLTGPVAGRHFALLLLLLRTPQHRQVRSLVEAIKSARARGGEAADEESVQVAARHALEVLVPLSSQKDHWRLASLLVGASKQL